MKSKSISTIIRLASEIKKLSAKAPKSTQAKLNKIQEDLLEEIKNF